MAEIVLYSDLNLNTPYESPLVTNIDSIRQALLVLLNTVKGERHFLPTYGVNIDDIVFDLIAEETEITIYQEIISSIEKWEPRLILDYAGTNVTAYPDNNSYDIDVSFRIEGLETNNFYKLSGSLFPNK